MDAIGIPYTEEIGLPFASTHPCKMHACGHDCHTAMLLGTAKVLKEMTSDIHCCVKFIFQYAEEILGGAKTIFERAESMGGEDFAYFLQHKPGAMFQLGVGTEGKPIIPIHNGKMVVNEDGLDIAPQIFIQYILDQMER